MSLDVLLIDNYDSFTHNLAHGLQMAGARVEVVRNDAVTWRDVQERAPQAIVLSPGPGHPAKARDVGVGGPILRGRHAIPVFGVCLGLQSMAHESGGRVVRAPRPVHGEASPVDLEEHALFTGLPRRIQAARYHSLVVEEDTLPKAWRVLARGEGLVMAAAHRRLPRAGVQFHPESILTPVGPRLLRNVVAWLRDPS